MRAWLAHHGHSARTALARFLRAPLGNALNVLVVGIMLSLPATLYVLVDNLRAASRQISTAPQISAFMALDASRAEVAQIESRLKQSPRVARYRFMPREQALQQLRQSSGLADVIDSLPQNPLPDAFIIESKDSGAAALESLSADIRQWPRVAHVQLDAAWARRLDAVLRTARLLAIALGCAFSVALVAVTFNTIRLQVLTQREELEVTRLIGATAAFMRRPFLYYGGLLGLLGGAMACVIVATAIWLLNRNLGELSHVYASLLELRSMPPATLLTMAAMSTFLGWLGARISVSHTLRDAWEI